MTVFGSDKHKDSNCGSGGGDNYNAAVAHTHGTLCTMCVVGEITTMQLYDTISPRGVMATLSAPWSYIPINVGILNINLGSQTTPVIKGYEEIFREVKV